MGGFKLKVGQAGSSCPAGGEQIQNGFLRVFRLGVSSVKLESTRTLHTYESPSSDPQSPKPNSQNFIFSLPPTIPESDHQQAVGAAETAPGQGLMKCPKDQQHLALHSDCDHPQPSGRLLSACKLSRLLKKVTLLMVLE